MKIDLKNGTNLTDNTQEIDENSIFVKTALNEKYAKNLPCKIIAPNELKKYLAHSPKIIGITGTNGKTTTASCIYSMLLTLGFKAALIGTRGVFINDSQVAPKGLTTPTLLELYHFIHLASLQNCDFVIMEVSSHAIAQKRIEGLDFALKILTNIQSDHLDFHKTLQNYIDTKNAFFADSALKLINKDCDLARFNVENAYTYGIENVANLKVEAYCARPNIHALILWNNFRTKKSENANVKSCLTGKYNLYNIIAAISAVRLVLADLSLEQIADSLNEFGGVEGRMQVVNQNPLVVVDFAHTAEGMQNIFEAFLGAKIVVVFGAGGNRDKTKRPKMGKVAEIYAQKIYLTSDNPRDEKAENIIAEILGGIKNKEKVITQANRKNAIISALEGLKSDEILLILGKGDETYQIIGSEKIPFDDRQIVRDFYAKS
ncbi:UDP-N-acetylmuramoyl-L-alanyl-D-glutamate--2,6-diaminopimelate ligase [Helicobacter sp. 23-1044]